MGSPVTPETDNRPPITPPRLRLTSCHWSTSRSYPIRVGRGIADAVLHAVTPESPAPPSELLVVDGMPEGVPAAALRPEPELPAPAGWPFGEEFPRTCGTSRFAGGALFWTDFLYDDHGATGVSSTSRPAGGAAARHVHLPRRARGPQRRRHLPRRRRAHRNRHVVAGRLEHAARPVRPHRAVHVRHRPRGKRPPTSGRRGRASAPPASTWHCSSRLRARG